jgi:hypothetical protein
VDVDDVRFDDHGGDRYALAEVEVMLPAGSPAGAADARLAAFFAAFGSGGAGAAVGKVLELIRRHDPERLAVLKQLFAARGRAAPQARK